MHNYKNDDWKHSNGGKRNNLEIVCPEENEKPYSLTHVKSDMQTDTLIKTDKMKLKLGRKSTCGRQKGKNREKGTN